MQKEKKFCFEFHYIQVNCFLICMFFTQAVNKLDKVEKRQLRLL